METLLEPKPLMVFVTHGMTPYKSKKRAYPISWRIESSLEFKTLSFSLDVFVKGPCIRFFKSKFSAAFRENRFPRWFREKIRPNFKEEWAKPSVQPPSYHLLVALKY